MNHAITPAFGIPASPFDLWAEVAASASRGRRQLSGASIGDYRSIWNTFERYLGSHGCPWHQATPDVAETFLRDHIPSSRKDGCGTPSTVTLKRYWRVLRDIYAVAVLQRSIQTNPFAIELATGWTEQADALVLAPHLLAQLVQGLQLDYQRAQQQALDPKKWQPMRDVAVLAFLLLTAAKTSEVTATSIMDVRPFDQDAQRGQRLPSVTIGTASGLAQRTFVPPRTQYAQGLWVILAQWCELRQQVAGVPQWLFFGQKHESLPPPDDLLASASPKLRCALSEKSVFLIVASAINRHLADTVTPHSIAHRGAQALRNSVLSSWLLSGTSQEDVMGYAGISDPRSIVRLDLKGRTGYPDLSVFGPSGIRLQERLT